VRLDGKAKLRLKEGDYLSLLLVLVLVVVAAGVCTSFFWPTVLVGRDEDLETQYYDHGDTVTLLLSIQCGDAIGFRRVSIASGDHARSKANCRGRSHI
jgi:hypothetical protein